MTRQTRQGRMPAPRVPRCRIERTTFWPAASPAYTYVRPIVSTRKSHELPAHAMQKLPRYPPCWCPLSGFTLACCSTSRHRRSGMAAPVHWIERQDHRAAAQCLQGDGGAERRFRAKSESVWQRMAAGPSSSLVGVLTAFFLHGEDRLWRTL